MACTEPSSIDLEGSDAELAARISGASDHPVVRWIPTEPTDLGRSVGRAPGVAPEGALVAPMDVIVSDVGLAVNALVWGSDPATVGRWTRMRPVTVTIDDRVRWSAPACSVVIANGEFVHGMPIAPKAHPGDGRLDVVVIAVAASQRRVFRARLAHGDHLPHPRIAVLRGRTIRIAGSHAQPVVTDGVTRGRYKALAAHSESDRWRLIL